LGSGVHALPVLLIAPGDGNEFDLLQVQSICVLENLAAGVPKDDAAQLECFGLARVLCSHDFTGACGKEESCDQQIDGVVKGASFGLPGRP
jgi:hypothetical protein